MKRSTTTSTTRRAVLRPNVIGDGGRRRRILVTLGAILALALLAGGTWGYLRLRDLWLEQCVIDDFAAQVTVNGGKMVKPDVIAEEFGLRKGANAALIDFDTRRREILAKIPNLRDLKVTRQLPNRVTVVVEEREPFVKMNVRGGKTVTGRVADKEGVVFVCYRNTQALPTIRETGTPTPPGKRLSQRGMAALAVAEACADPALQEVQFLECDISKPNYLLLVLSDYSRVRLAWDGMDAPSSRSAAALRSQLDAFASVYKSDLGHGTRTWDATIPNQISALDPGGIQ